MITMDQTPKVFAEIFPNLQTVTIMRHQIANERELSRWKRLLANLIVIFVLLPSLVHI